MLRLLQQLAGRNGEDGERDQTSDMINCDIKCIAIYTHTHRACTRQNIVSNWGESAWMEKNDEY